MRSAATYLLLPALLLLALGAAPAASQSSDKSPEQSGAMAAPADTAQPSAEVLELGKKVFTELAEPQCAVCHTLADAEASGEIGPNLDELMPDAARVNAAVTSGIGIMPSFADTLSEEQIDAVAAYVDAATHGKLN